MKRTRATVVCLFATLLSSTADPVDFVRDIRPLLSDTCYNCHGPDAKARKANLRLDDRKAAFRSGVLTDGEMFRRLASNEPDNRMPPPESNRTLSAQNRAKILKWLKAGAAWPNDDRHWAFVPPKRPPLARVKNSTWPRNGIDHFILAKLESEQLAPSPEANKAALLRRVSFDLTGLPPTIEELENFLSDPSPNAYEKVVHRLLDSPRYGENMALGWLDASRYADTDGYQNDRLRYMWVWRDWVIRAFNDNMPFDRFVTEQTAGDLLQQRNFFTQVATGFNRNHRINSEGGSIPDEWIVEYVADRVETMGTVFLGLTLNCARCHDHKYDPISQKDFYRLFAFFNGIDEAGLGPNNGNSPPFIPVPKNWPNLSGMAAQFVKPEPMEIKVVQTSVPRPQSGSSETVMVMHELAKPRPTFVLSRGQYDQPDKSEQLYPATPPTLGGWNKKWPGTRIGLANWLTNPEHPLTARVTVNRMWQHHFGLGLVKTSENFGLQGEHPSHPELLDWLATEFIRRDWNVKSMHKLIVSSATYRQTSARRLENDAENRLISRGPRKRLTPFAIRDTALFTSNLIVGKIGGPSVKPYMPPGIWKSISNSSYKQDTGEKLYRRGMYTYWRRTLPPPTMMTFNAATRETCTVRNDITTTPLQALTLLNNKTFVESARFLAQRMLQRDDQPAERIAWAFRSVTSRTPTPAELALLLEDLNLFEKDFSNNLSAAKKLLNIGENKPDNKLQPVKHAAYTLVANTILNLDESIMQN